MSEPAPATHTILFTDMVASTLLRSQLGEERADELRRVHDRLLTEQVEIRGGRVVKGGGDGIMAAFGAASDAVSAAVAIQQAVARYSLRSDRIAEMIVRIGLSVGDVSWEGGDCFGVPVIEAARLNAVAEGRQILCTDFVRAMARGRGGHDFRSVGERELKGMPEPVKACEVVWEVEPRSLFPLPATLRAVPRFRFVGRDIQLDRGRTLLDTASGTRVLWVVGEPGIGKTRLASELARERHDSGWMVLFGHAEENLATPYRPIVEVLRSVVDGSSDRELPKRLGPDPAELVRLVPQIGERLALPEQPASGDPSVARYRLFEAVRLMFAALAADGPVVLLLDDVHWAAAPTFELLGHLLREPTDPGPAIVVTFRQREAPPSLVRVVDEAVERHGSMVISLTGIEADDVASLISELPGSVGDQEVLVTHIHEETAGNPFFVTALLRQLERQGGLESRTLSGDVGSAVRQRVAHVGEHTRGALRVASLIGLEFDLRVLARTLDRSKLDVLDAMEDAARVGLVEECALDRFRFAHALVRNALRAELGDTRRVATHRQIAEAIEEVYESSMEDHVEALAAHWAEAAAVEGDAVGQAALYAERAGERALGQAAYDQAAAAFVGASELYARRDGGESRDWCRVLIRAGETCRRNGQLQDAVEALCRASSSAELHGWVDLQVSAASTWQKALTWFGEASHDTVRALERALDALDDPNALEIRGGLLTSLSMAYRNIGEIALARVAMAEGLQLAEQLDDAALWLEVHNSVATTDPGAADAALRLDVGRRAIRRGREAGLVERTALESVTFMFTLVEQERLAEASAAVDNIEEVGAALRHQLLSYMGRTARSMLAFLRGDFVAAEQHATEADDLGRRLGGRDRAGVYGVQLFTIRREQGRLDEVEPAMRLVARRGDDAATWGPGLAAVYAALGMLDETAVELARLVSPDGIGLANDSRFALSLSYLIDACTAVRDRARAASLYGALLPYEPLSLVTSGVVSHGPAPRYLGMLAVVLGRWDDARRHLDDALFRCRAMGTPVWEAHTHLWLARLHRERPDASAEASLEHANACRELARRYGMTAVAAEAEALTQAG